MPTAESQKVVVYVEDEAELVDLLRLILKEEQVILKHSLNGREGLELIRQVKPDLVILDLMLPELGGWEIFEIMQEDESPKDIHVVVITVRTEGREGVWPQVQQLAGYLVKPFAIQELREVIHKALEAPPD